MCKNNSDFDGNQKIPRGQSNGEPLWIPTSSGGLGGIGKGIIRAGNISYDVEVANNTKKGRIRVSAPVAFVSALPLDDFAVLLDLQQASAFCRWAWSREAGGILRLEAVARLCACSSNKRQVENVLACDLGRVLENDRLYALLERATARLCGKPYCEW